MSNMKGLIDVVSNLLGRLEHEVASHRVLDSFRHLLPAMDEHALLKNKDSPHHWLNVQKMFFVRSPESGTSPCQARPLHW